jgi:hypothetical protein
MYSNKTICDYNKNSLRLEKTVVPIANEYRKKFTAIM